jgi:Sulfatase
VSAQLFLRCVLLILRGACRNPLHVNIGNDNPLRFNKTDPVGGLVIPQNMTTIADKLKSSGYATHYVGKWHVGCETPALLPKGKHPSLCACQRLQRA